MNFHSTLPMLLIASGIASSGFAQQVRVAVTVENAAPSNGTFQTPVWIGFHDGTFDTYSGGTLASSLPIPGSVAMERLAEDGNTGPISADFDTLAVGRAQATLFGPSGPLGPRENSNETFLLDPSDVRDRFFSYASMVIPSNDAFVANGNPLAHPMFDDVGNFIGEDFFVAGQNAVNDVGTEANDEFPGNTAFFGQMAPNTGVTESNVIVTHPGFLTRGAGGILDAGRFRDGDFTIPGYPFLRVGFRIAPAITDVRTYSTLLLGALEVPPVPTAAFGLSAAILIDGGTRLAIVVQAIGLQDLTMAHLHLGSFGENGPVVADLLTDVTPVVVGPSTFFIAEVETDGLLGPIAGFPLDELIGRVEAGEIYVNLHSTAFPSGEIRGQLGRLN